MVKFVENELVNIKTEVNDMWTLVYQQLDNAYKSLLNIVRHIIFILDTGRKLWLSAGQTTMRF